jgi:hypothetical protein
VEYDGETNLTGFVLAVPGVFTGERTVTYATTVTFSLVVVGGGTGPGALSSSRILCAASFPFRLLCLANDDPDGEHAAAAIAEKEREAAAAAAAAGEDNKPVLPPPLIDFATFDAATARADMLGWRLRKLFESEDPHDRGQMKYYYGRIVGINRNGYRVDYGDRDSEDLYPMEVDALRFAWPEGESDAVQKLEQDNSVAKGKKVP